MSHLTRKAQQLTALLKVAQCEAISQVARSGLLKHVDRHSIKDWIIRYQKDGLSGLPCYNNRHGIPASQPPPAAAFTDLAPAVSFLEWAMGRRAGEA